METWYCKEEDFDGICQEQNHARYGERIGIWYQKKYNHDSAKNDNFPRAIQAATKTTPITKPFADFVRIVGTPAKLIASPQSTMYAQWTNEDWNRNMGKNQIFPENTGRQNRGLGMDYLLIIYRYIIENL